MKCYYHPMNDSVAICFHCGKMGCRECIHEAHDGMVCRQCMAKIVTKIRTKFIIHFIVSTLFAIAGAWYGFYIEQSGHTTLSVGGLISTMSCLAYVFWATYWGWGPVWRIWRKVTSGIGCASSVFLLPIIICIFFEIPFFFAACYGMFGGGIFEFIKALIAVRREKMSSQPLQVSQQHWGPQNIQPQPWIQPAQLSQQWDQQPQFQQYWNASYVPQFSQQSSLQTQYPQQWSQQPQFSQQFSQQPQFSQSQQSGQQPQFRRYWNAPSAPQFSQQSSQQLQSSQRSQFQRYWNAPSAPQFAQQWGQQNSPTTQEWGQSQQT